VKYDRRYNERYPLPGATVKYQIDVDKAAEKPVKDITHGGVCFDGLIFIHNCVPVVNRGAFVVCCQLSVVDCPLGVGGAKRLTWLT